MSGFKMSLPWVFIWTHSVSAVSSNSSLGVIVKKLNSSQSDKTEWSPHKLWMTSCWPLRSTRRDQRQSIANKMDPFGQHLINFDVGGVLGIIELGKAKCHRQTLDIWVLFTCSLYIFLQQNQSFDMDCWMDKWESLMSLLHKQNA